MHPTLFPEVSWTGHASISSYLVYTVTWGGKPMNNSEFETNSRMDALVGRCGIDPEIDSGCRRRRAALPTAPDARFGCLSWSRTVLLFPQSQRYDIGRVAPIDAVSGRTHVAQSVSGASTRIDYGYDSRQIFQNFTGLRIGCEGLSTDYLVTWAKYRL